MLLRFGYPGSLYVSFSEHDFFQSDLGMNVVEISRCLEGRISKAAKGLECVVVPIFLDIPAR